MIRLSLFTLGSGFFWSTITSILSSYNEISFNWKFPLMMTILYGIGLYVLIPFLKNLWSQAEQDRKKQTVLFLVVSISTLAGLSYLDFFVFNTLFTEIRINIHAGIAVIVGFVFNFASPYRKKS